MRTPLAPATCRVQQWRDFGLWFQQLMMSVFTYMFCEASMCVSLRLLACIRSGRVGMWLPFTCPTFTSLWFLSMPLRAHKDA